MSKENLQKLNDEWSLSLKNENKIHERINTGFMVYEPFSDNYWSEKIKICICNLESYGYEKCGETKVTLSCFEQWMKDTSETKTSRYSAVFINALVNRLSNNILSINQIRESYYKINDLKESIEKTAYMNFRKRSNGAKNQDINEILKETENSKEKLKEYFIELEANILIIGGQVGVTAFNKVFRQERQLKYGGYVKINEMHVFSVKHFSRINYANFYKKINFISDTISLK